MRRSRPQQERSKVTRRGLIRTATRLWSERGFDDVTVEEICSAAGVGRTTFYLHFESKEQLLHSLAGATAVGVATELDHVRQTGTLDDQLDVFICGVSRRMVAVPKSLVQLVIHSWRARAARAPWEDTGAAPSFADLLRELLTEARSRGELIATADTTELGAILGALTMDAIEDWASGQSDDRPLEAVLRFRVDLIVRPFQSRKPGPTG
jgi:AcrR family transcriptional regulator